MSRTDKDAPWWVRSTWFEPVHMYCQYDLTGRFFWSRFPQRRVCDLLDEPALGNFSHGSITWKTIHRNPELAHCRWEPMWPSKNRYKYTRPPSRAEKHLEWWGPDRAHVRDLMIRARQQYNGSGDVDIVEPTRHHRHAGKGGWWD